MPDDSNLVITLVKASMWTFNLTEAWSGYGRVRSKLCAQTAPAKGQLTGFTMTQDCGLVVGTFYILANSMSDRQEIINILFQERAYVSN
jgi:hypothetical protein